MAESGGFNARWKVHIQKLQIKKHHSPKLQSAYNKYGSERFIFEVVKTCLPDECIDREDFHIGEFDSFNNGFNCAPKAGSMLGFKHDSKSWEKRTHESKRKRESYKKRVEELYGKGLNYGQIARELETYKGSLEKS